MRMLISGASVAGPVLAYWLTRHGYSVTVVERASTSRLGVRGLVQGARLISVLPAGTSRAFLRLTPRPHASTTP